MTRREYDDYYYQDERRMEEDGRYHRNAAPERRYADESDRVVQPWEKF